MTIGQYLLLAAIVYPATFLLCYQCIYKPAKRKISERYSVRSKALEFDTETVSGELYRVEERQVLVIPTECELGVSVVKIKRVAGALVINTTDKV